MPANENFALIEEARHQLTALTALAVAIRAAGLAEPAAAQLTRETPVDFANGVAMLADATDPLNRADYEHLVQQLGYTPALDLAALINYDLRDGFVAALRAW
jgi:hypothetical protein